jgi:predicted phage gp36 major capsid-like protein
MALPALIARADSREQKRDPSKVPGSTARQLLLKRALDMEVKGTLVAELNQNKKIWHSMKPEELRSLRERYYAFLKQDGKKQIELMKAAEKFHRLTDEQRRAYLKRASWLKKVVSRLTPEQRQALRKLSPAERARRLLELKAKLSDPPPATQPASQPTSKTADYWSE